MNSPGSAFIGGADDGSSFFDVVSMPCMRNVAAMPAAAPRASRWAIGRGRSLLRIITTRASGRPSDGGRERGLPRNPDRVALALHVQAGVDDDPVERFVPWNAGHIDGDLGFDLRRDLDLQARELAERLHDVVDV